MKDKKYFKITDLEKFKKQIESFDPDDLNEKEREKLNRILNNLEEIEKSLKELKEINAKITEYESENTVVTTEKDIQIIKKGDGFSAN